MCVFNTADHFLYLEPRGNDVMVKMGRGKTIGPLPIMEGYTNFNISGGWPQGYIATVTGKESGKTYVYHIEDNLNFRAGN